jgi:hypothetical protein
MSEASGAYLHESLQRGRKDDTGKLMWHLVPLPPMEAVVRVLTNGAARYGENNWMDVPNARARYYDAFMRHLQAWWMGEKLDPDDGEPHLAHAVCCALFLMHFDERSERNDSSLHCEPLYDRGSTDQR